MERGKGHGQTGGEIKGSKERRKDKGSLFWEIFGLFCNRVPASSSPSPTHTTLVLGADEAERPVSVGNPSRSPCVPCWHLHTLLLLPQQGLLKGGSLVPYFLPPSPGRTAHRSHFSIR